MPWSAETIDALSESGWRPFWRPGFDRSVYVMLLTRGDRHTIRSCPAFVPGLMCFAQVQMLEMFPMEFGRVALYYTVPFKLALYNFTRTSTAKSLPAVILLMCPAIGLLLPNPVPAGFARWAGAWKPGVSPSTSSRPSWRCALILGAIWIFQLPGSSCLGVLAFDYPTLRKQVSRQGTQ